MAGENSPIKKKKKRARPLVERNAEARRNVPKKLVSSFLGNEVSRHALYQKEQQHRKTRELDASCT